VLLLASQKVPKVVSEFVLYRTVWNDVHRHEKSAGFIITGQTGSGKSWLALRIAQDLDPSFIASIEKRVVYTAEDFIRLVAYGKLRRGNVIIFDEMAHAEGADSRAAMSRTNRLLSGIVSTYRQKGLIVIWVLPTLTQLDKNIRMVSITGFFKILGIDYVRKQSRVSYYSNSLNAIYGKSYYKTPIITVDGRVKKIKVFRFNAPSRLAAKRYRVLKNRFVDYIAKKAADETLVAVESKPKSIKDYAKLVEDNLEKFIRGGRLDKTVIEAELGVGRIKADTIYKFVSLSKISKGFI
jgi:hypothetical protein